MALQPLRNRLDYDEDPKVISDRQSDMLKEIPMQDYDSCPCEQESPQSPCEAEPQQPQMPPEKAFEPVIEDYDDGEENPEGINIVVLRRVFAHCMDNEFKKIKGILSKLEDKDRKVVESALSKIHKKYQDLEQSQEDDGR